MVDVAPSPGLDSPALGPNRDPQGHLRSPVSKLKASLWVPGGVDSTAECLKFEKIQNVCSFLNCWVQPDKKCVDCGCFKPVFIAASQGGNWSRAVESEFQEVLSSRGHIWKNWK